MTEDVTAVDTAATGPARRERHYLIGGAAAACAACCAPPLLALVGIAGGGALATAATFAFAGLAFALVVGAASVIAFVMRTRRRS